VAAFLDGGGTPVEDGDRRGALENQERKGVRCAVKSKMRMPSDRAH
jgi:hypothetical protein